MTSVEPEPSRPSAADAAALYDALTAVHAAIYGYGIVSAHSTPDVNDLVAQALSQHRSQRETLITMLSAHSVAAPLAAAGYRLPMAVDDPTAAANLAVQMENDAAVAWRAVLEQAKPDAGADDDRAYAVAALTQCALLAARWKQVLKAWPVTQAFPGGSD
ncbi:ferritin-like domain-containing protein [Mycolicibacterium komossense]|uniref:Ferritin-like domain-containing protein n=1 Tax=Mycolicibacterium komossense TaxID=1779 RepID=A0ABT3CGZ9_9MYCO|nr:ferritin-like domain-containing protein [Mycolicibacterium komossense]MCV7228742.1 ferritin-like domain-containing protein [Mycolicibacterium komossense]